MKAVKKTLGKYRWEIIVVWALILVASIGTVYVAGAGALSACSKISQWNTPQQPAKAVLAYTPPDIPPTLTDTRQRAAYLVAHYWDNFNFADTTWIAAPNADALEQAFVDYLDLLPHVTKQVADASLRETLVKARTGAALMDWFTGQFDRYLYDPNSPMRDEERYAVVVEHIIADSKIDSVYKIRPAYQLEEINKNRKGKVATDFTYVLAGGKRGRLHGIQSEYTLVYFYNPDCGDCKRTKEVLKSSAAVSGMVSGGKLKILALYPDKDLGAWKSNASEIPAAWINGYAASPEVKDKLYAIRAIPSLYLLDRSKRVVLKDATAEQAEAVLIRL